MKRVVYHWVEMRTILIPKKVCTDSYGIMIRDIQEKVCEEFIGNEGENDIRTEVDIEKADTRDWEIVSVDPIPEEKAIEKARRLRGEFLNSKIEIPRDYNRIHKIFDAYDQAYKEDAGE